MSVRTRIVRSGPVVVAVGALITATIVGASVTTARADSPGDGSGGGSGLDRSFGDGGRFRSYSPEATARGGFREARALQARADDRLVFAGDEAVDDQSPPQMVVGQLTAQGAPDTSTGGGDGIATWKADASSHDVAGAVTVDHLGRVVVGGWTVDPAGVSRMAVVRFTADLRLDPTFGDDGAVVIADSPGHVRDLQEQPDGKIVLAGELGTPARMAVVRLTEDGALDPTFGGGDGVALVAATQRPAGARGVSITADAKIVLAGRTGDVTRYSGGDAVLARLLPDGSRDRSFAGDGVLRIAGQGLSDVVVRPDGQLVVVGPSGSQDGPTRFVLVAGDGRLADWPGTTNPQETQPIGFFDMPMQLVLQGDSKVVAVGRARDSDYGDSEDGTDFTVLRRAADGSPDGTFAARGARLLSWDEDGPEYAAFASGQGVTVDSQGRVVVAGRAPARDAPVTAGIARFAGTPIRRTTRIESRQTYSTGSWRPCGETSDDPCSIGTGAQARFSGRTWPTPDTGEVRLQVQHADASDNTTVPGWTTREGNYRTSFTATRPGSYRVRLKVPDTDTTILTAGPWRYFDVTA